MLSIQERLTNIETDPYEEIKYDINRKLDSKDPYYGEKESDYQQRRGLQKEIISKIDENQIQNLFKTLVETNSSEMTQGAVFEWLCDVQTDIQETQLALEIKSILKHPPYELGFHTNIYRNPDLIRVVEDNNTSEIKIEEVIETKSAPLSDRGVAQLFGFKDGFIEISNILSRADLSKINKLGFTSLADNLSEGKILKLNESFKTSLMIPANIRKVDEEYDTKLVNEKGLPWIRAREHYDELVEDILPKTNIINSAFTVEEVNKVIIPVLKKHYEFE